MINQIRFPYEVEYVSAFFCVFNINIIIPESMPALALPRVVQCLHWLYRVWSNAFNGSTEVVQCLHWLYREWFNACNCSTGNGLMPALALQKAVKCLHWLYREWSTAYIGFTESGSMPALARALERVVQSFHWLNKLSSIACMHGLIEIGSRVDQCL